jgi:uncharacterized membrane protein YeaQ/YmgE (transglycosylase-associated protein family)
LFFFISIWYFCGNKISNTKMKPFLMLLIGALVGWLFSKILKRSILGVLGNILVGILGAYIGYWTFRQLGVDPGPDIVSGMVRGAIGATVIVLLFNFVLKKRN